MSTVDAPQVQVPPTPSVTLSGLLTIKGKLRLIQAAVNRALTTTLDAIDVHGDATTSLEAAQLQAIIYAITGVEMEMEAIREILSKMAEVEGPDSEEDPE